MRGLATFLFQCEAPEGATGGEGSPVGGDSSQALIGGGRQGQVGTQGVLASGSPERKGFRVKVQGMREKKKNTRQ